MVDKESMTERLPYQPFIYGICYFEIDQVIHQQTTTKKVTSSLWTPVPHWKRLSLS